MKKNELLFNSINELSDELLTMAAPEKNSSFTETAEKICEVRQEYVMKKSKKSTFMRITAVAASVAVIAGLAFNTVNKKNTLNRNDNYPVSDVNKNNMLNRKDNHLVSKLPGFEVTEMDLSGYYEFFNEVYYDNGKLHISGCRQNIVGQVNEVSLSDKKIINTISVPEEYSYGPYNYVNGVFYDKGCRYYYGADSPENQLDAVALILSACCSDNKIYGLSTTENQRNYIFERNTETDALITKNLDDVINYDYSNTYFSAVTADEKNIYIAAFEVSLSGGGKAYTPYLYVLDKEYNLINTITDIDIDMPEFAVANSDGTVIMGAYNYEEGVTESTIVNISLGRSEYSVETSGNCSFYPGKDRNHMFMSDNSNKIYTFDSESEEKNILYNLAESGNLSAGEKLQIIECNDNSLSYIIVFDGEENVTYSLNSNGIVEEEKNNNNFYRLMLSDYGVEYIYDYAGNILVNTDNDFSSDSVLYRSENGVYINDDDKLCIIEDKEIKEIELEQKKVYSIVHSEDDDYVICSEKKNIYISKIKDGKTDGLLDLKKLFGECDLSEINFLDGDNEYDVYTVYKGILYGINYESETADPLADFSLESVNANAVLKTEEGYLVLEDKKLYSFTEKSSDLAADGKNIRSITISVSENAMKRKIFKTFVDNFKMQHSDAEIRIVQYSGIENEDGYSLSLENDYINNSLPDIVFISDNSSEFFKLEGSGAFCDLNDFIDSDPEFNETNYMMNIIKSFSLKNRQYAIPLNFKLETITTRYDLDKSYEYGWNYDEYIKSIATKSEIPLFTIMKKSYLSGALNLADNPDFIDYNEYKSFYDSEKFISLIDSINKYGADESSDDLEEFYSAEKFIFSAHDSLKRNAYEYRTADKLLHSIKGYPSDSGNYSYAEAGCLASISASSENKELCWEFIKSLISSQTDEYYGKDGYYFSVNKNNFTAEMEIIKRQTDAKFVDALKSLIDGVHAPYRNNIRVGNILYEELQLFFNGERNAEETAKVIQNKVSLYLNETK